MSFRLSCAAFPVALAASGCATEDFADEARVSPPAASAVAEARTEFSEALAVLDTIAVEPERPTGYIGTTGLTGSIWTTTA